MEIFTVDESERVPNTFRVTGSSNYRDYIVIVL